MKLETQPVRVITSADRRVICGVRLVDAHTNIALSGPGKITVISAFLVRDLGNQVVPIKKEGITFDQNRSGIFFLRTAPFFDVYTRTFMDPQPPAETQTGPLRLQCIVTTAGTTYLPQSFFIDLPRSTDPKASENVFEPVQIPLFRSPSAPVQHGWSIIRARVTESGASPKVPLPGVLIRVFRNPRGEDDAPIGFGMTEWRGRTAGEALVAVTGIPRFRPGEEEALVETSMKVDVELSRHVDFNTSAGPFPNPSQLLIDVKKQDPVLGFQKLKLENRWTLTAGKERKDDTLEMP